MSADLIILFLIFMTVVVLTFYVLDTLGKRSVRKRIVRFVEGQARTESDANSDFVQKLVRLVDPISRISLPEEGWEQSLLQTKFVNAGWRNPHVPKLFYATKTIITFMFGVIAYSAIGLKGFKLNPSEAMFHFFLLLAVGYYLPNVVLHHYIKKRQAALFEGLPEMADLLLICIEAGLSFEQSFARVSKELKLKLPLLAEEMELVLLETRSGFVREKAMRNFYLRTGLDDVETLVTMLNQSERFGTSVGVSLRIYGENVRSKRRQHAEELAAKIPLKLLFPLMFCLMPAIFIVMMLPSIMQIKNSLSM